MKKTSLPLMTRQDVQILDRKTVYRGFYQVEKYQLRHQLFQGGMSDSFERELIIRYPVAAALPYDPVRDEVVLIEQFRIGALEDPHSPWLLEVVAGILTGEETLEELARREVWEEAGLRTDILRPLYRYWVSPGGSQEQVSLFLAKVDASQAGGIHGLANEHEDIRVRVMRSAEAFAAVRDGRINNATTIMALQWLELHLPAPFDG